MHQIEKTKLIHDRLNRHDKRKKRKLRQNLNLNEKIPVLTKKIRKK